MRNSSKPQNPDPPPLPDSRNATGRATLNEPDWPPTARSAPPRWGPPWIGPILDRAQIDLAWLWVAVLMMATGLIFFGWRGLTGVAITGLSSLLAYTSIQLAVRLLRPARAFDSSLHVLVLGLLLGMALPAQYSWTLPAAAGVVLGFAAHLVGRSRRVRVHPVSVSMLIVLLGAQILGDNNSDTGGRAWRWPQSVLRVERVVIGDLFQATAGSSNQPWFRSRHAGKKDALVRTEPREQLRAFEPQILADRSTLGRLLMSGQLVAMFDLLLGAVPGPVGGSSRAMLVAIGFYLIYRRLAWWPMAAVAFVAGFLAIAAMPVTYQGRTTLAVWRLMELGSTVAVTYLAYMILASPMAFIVLILAPQTAPTSARGKLVYGAMIGGLLIIADCFLAVPMAGHLSLVVAGLVSRPLDALHKNPFVP